MEVFDISEIKNQNFTPSQKFVMINRMLSCSEKLREHLLHCEKACNVEKKFSFFLHSFLTFEKKENKEIDISEIMDEEFVNDCIFSDKSCKLIK